jgi:hypothetical protein
MPSLDRKSGMPTDVEIPLYSRMQSEKADVFLSEPEYSHLPERTMIFFALPMSSTASSIVLY